MTKISSSLLPIKFALAVVVACNFSSFASAQVLTPVAPNPAIAATDAPAVINPALKNYVDTPDASVSCTLAESGSSNGCTWLRYNLVSQTWHGIAWRHVVWLLLPEDANSTEQKPAYKIEGDSAILFIAGGSWKGDWSVTPAADLRLPREYPLLSYLAIAAKCPLAIVEQIPFQPILDGRYEDAIIAETFRRFLMGEGEDWPLLLPMTKAAVAAMNAMQGELQNRFKISIDHFTLTGASKRGWTTWLTAAIDSRVAAIAPMVIDMLNMPAQMQHQLDSWGGYSEEIADYTALNLQKNLATPRGQLLQSIVDPYAYRTVLNQPKLLIFGTNDRYWTLDSCNLYWDDLQGPKYLTYVPNQGHQIGDFARLVGPIAALHRSYNGGPAMPKLSWTFADRSDKLGRLKVKCDVATNAVNMWVATAPTKDFRLARWVSQPMLRGEQDAPGEYFADLSRGSNGYLAFFGEVEVGDPAIPAYFSTNVTILGSSE